jgi:hypothetical protein
MPVVGIGRIQTRANERGLGYAADIRFRPRLVFVRITPLETTTASPATSPSV